MSDVCMICYHDKTFIGQIDQRVSKVDGRIRKYLRKPFTLEIVPKMDQQQQKMMLVPILKEFPLGIHHILKKEALFDHGIEIPDGELMSYCDVSMSDELVAFYNKLSAKLYSGLEIVAGDF